VNIKGSVKAALPPIDVSWKKGGQMVNNGHTIQINVATGNMLARGGSAYEMLQYHFHHPSEHLVDGKPSAMEAHFVHQKTGSEDLGVLGVFLVPGAENPAFSRLAAAFPAKEGAEGFVDDVDPNGLLPGRLGYWFYEGSLTTPPCTEDVDWMLAMMPLEVAASDIGRFAVLYPDNARPVMPSNRRFILHSS
jgi:carbonic anhydrase